MSLVILAARKAQTKQGDAAETSSAVLAPRRAQINSVDVKAVPLSPMATNVLIVWGSLK